MADKKDEKPCLLIALPAELRNTIYSLVLVEQAPIAIKRNIEPGLLATNHQIRAEAMAVFYSMNTFQSRSDYLLLSVANAASWIRKLGKLRTQMLTSLQCGGGATPGMIARSIEVGFAQDVYIEGIPVKRVTGLRKDALEFERSQGETNEYVWVKLTAIEEIEVVQVRGGWKVKPKQRWHHQDKMASRQIKTGYPY